MKLLGGSWVKLLVTLTGCSCAMYSPTPAVLLIFSSGLKLGQGFCPRLTCRLHHKTNKHQCWHSQFPCRFVSPTLSHSSFPAVSHCAVPIISPAKGPLACPGSAGGQAGAAQHHPQCPTPATCLWRELPLACPSSILLLICRTPIINLIALKLWLFLQPWSKLINKFRSYRAQRSGLHTKVSLPSRLCSASSQILF